MNELKIHDLPNGIIYIENAFPESQKFLQEIEDSKLNGSIPSIIPEWDTWIDGIPIKKVYEDGTVGWETLTDPVTKTRGKSMTLDWDTTLSDNNDLWPRPEILPDYDDDHRKAYEILKKIDTPYKEMLGIWSEKTGNSFPSTWITKNYTIRTYKTGGGMGPHIDKNIENPANTMDWTALIYLNDDYEGGELVFDNLDVTLKPSAGSVVFFPCIETHSVKEVLSGTKSYVFLFIHLDVGISTALGEPYQNLTKKIKLDRGLPL